MESKQMISLDWRTLLKKHGSIVILVVICLIASIIVPNFANLSNFILIVRQSAIPIIACIGMTIVLMTGGIDLSVGYTIGLTSISVGLMITSLSLPYWLAIILTLGIGMLVGFINGFCVQLIRVPAFITTLGMGYLTLGFSQIVSNGLSIHRLPPDFLAIGRTPIGNFNSTVLITIFVCIVFYYLLHRSTYGRQLSAFGLSEPTSRMSGVPISFINLSVYVINGFLAGIVGILLTIDVNSAQPTLGGGGYTFSVITAALLGGASLYGGVGSVIGAVFGTLILRVIQNCINLMNAPFYLSDAIVGIIILFAIIFENIKNRKL